MPYYAWQGVNILGDIKKGKTFARSEKELDILLFSRDIALLKSKKILPKLFIGSITLLLKVRFFRQLAVLLQSGVLLPEALESIARQADHSLFHEMICNITDNVYAGMTLSNALGRYPDCFDRFIIHIIYVGQETGRLPEVLKRLYSHLETIYVFNKKIRTALTLPFITFLFFCTIVVGVIVVVVPRLSVLFVSAYSELPFLTKLLINISNFFHSKALIFLGVGICLCVCIIQSFCVSQLGKRFLDKTILLIPFFNRIMHDSVRASWFESLASLIHSGVQVIPALKIANKSINNSILCDYLDSLIFSVASGVSLSTACAQHPYQWFDQNIIAIIYAGESSGKLADSLSYVADEYREKVQSRLNFIITIIQPLLIVILGLFIALFVFAIYIPVFNLAQIVG